MVAADRGWCVVRRLREATSGAVPERDGLDELRAALRRAEAEVVVAFAVDRLSRSQHHIGILSDEFEHAGVRVEFVTERFEDAAVGRFILAASAFIAGVEREKIAERTMRGEEERARSGRTPQATGAGCYDYTYNPASGRREIEPFQAAVVHRIFERYAASHSFSAVSNEPNDAGIAAFSGGGGGGLVPDHGAAHAPQRGVHRPHGVPQHKASASSRVGGATPAIIDEGLWARVQAILNDPERTSRHPVAKRRYALRGRLRCGVCQSAMVVQTLSSKGNRYPYYRCRHAYTKSTSRACTARYIPAEALEQETGAEVRKVLTAPEVVLQELNQPDDSADAREAIQRLESELATLKKREERLVRPFGYDELDSEVVRAELREARRQRGARGGCASGLGDCGR